MRTLPLFFIAAAIVLLTPLAIYAQEFTPLTNLPGIENAADQATLPDFLNSLYRLCIGAAVVIAILQIMRAGMYFMFNKESVAHNEKGKSLISGSILGLLLVLSPAIVFGIINPDILDLRLDVSGLQPPAITSDLDTLPAPQQTVPQGVMTGTMLKKGVFPTKAGMEAFVAQCNAGPKIDKATPTIKGCTKTCPTPGSGSCDAEGCIEYTAYCGTVEVFYLEKIGEKYGPRPDDFARYQDFQRTCQADGGTMKASASSQATTCPGESVVSIKQGTCYLGALRCEL